MARRGGLKPFRRVKERLKSLGIIWNPRRGKGSHGAFIGPHQETGRKQTFPIPQSQQREITIDYLKGIRRRFGLTDEKWTDFFD